jgi:D-alanyl-lipoteichoic acid acyltransferase DltB (MBOAT superfamily)
LKPVVFLRVASLLTLIHAALHTIGGVFGKPVNATAAMVVATMRGYRFPVLGATRSYADFYRGLGLGITIFLTVEAIVFWQLASLAKSDSRRIRPVLATFLIGYLAMALNSFLFFFSAPVITEILIAACLGVAIATAKSEIPAPIANTGHQV